MATFEEKILAYLDDSLPSEERDDVRAQLTDGDGRATRLLNAHRRLQDLYGLAAKPVSAPLAIQRELASKVPVLAIKLPYLALPESRKRAAGWFWELPSFRMNAILILLSTLLVAGIWFAVKHGASGNLTHANVAKPSAANVSPASSIVPQNMAPLPANATGSATVGTTHLLRGMHSPGLSQRTYPSNLTHHVFTDHSFTNHSFTTHSLISQRAIFSRGNRLLARNAVPAQFVSMKQHDGFSEKVNQASPALDFQSELVLRPIDLLQQPARFRAEEAIPIAVNPESENKYIPVRAFVAENIRSQSLAPQGNPSDFARRYGVWQSSVTTESVELGIDYEITPWIAIGVRAGDARFVQEQQISHLESKSGGYGHLTSEVTETALLDPFAPWLCAAATYTPNPGERFEYSFTGAAGDIIVTGFSPTLLGEAAAIYKFDDAVALRMSLSYQASWVANANPVGSLPNTSDVSGTALQSVTSKLYPSRSLGVSLGVMFHP